MNNSIARYAHTYGIIAFSFSEFSLKQNFHFFSYTQNANI